MLTTSNSSDSCCSGNHEDSQGLKQLTSCVKVLPCCGCVWAESQKKGKDIKKEEKKKMHRMWACVEATDCLKMKGLFKGRKHIEEVTLNNICNFHR